MSCLLKSYAVVGSRSFNDYNYMKEVLEKYEIDEIVSGGCKYGADKLAEQYATEKDLVLTILLADWKNLGKKAGLIRNVDIVKRSDVVIAFWDGKSRGTKHTIDTAIKHNKKVIVYHF